MKKYLKIIFLSLLFLCSVTKIEAVTNVNKDFCEEERKFNDSNGKEGQKYIDDFKCENIEKQCTYKLDDTYAYVNITKDGGDARIWLDPSKLYITNWDSVNEFTSFDAKKWYQSNKKCPTYLVGSFSEGNGNFGVTKKYYLLNSLGKNYNLVYTLTAESTNVTSSETKNEEPSTISDIDSCAGFRTKEACKIGQTEHSGNFGCAWNEQYQFCSPTGLAYLSCGGTVSKDNKENNNKNNQADKESIAYDIPVMVPRLTSYAITALKTITPVILIIIGMFQLIKAISSQNEDEMKKARSALIKKLIAAAMIFFIVAIVQFIVKQVADKSEQSSTEACFDCFINNNCTNAMYYTDGYGKCYKVSCDSDKIEDCEIDCPVDNY